MLPWCVRPGLLSGMVELVDFLQPGFVDVEVHLGGADVRMAQQLLHDAQVGAASQHVGGEAVAQGVRGDVLLQADAGGILAHQSPDVGAVQRPPGPRKEKGVARAGPSQTWPLAMHVVAQGANGAAADRYDSFLVTLADAPQIADLEVDLRTGQPDGFAYPNAGSVEQFEQGPVSLIELLRWVRRVEQGVDLLLVDRLRDGLPAFGRLDQGDQVTLEAALGMTETQEHSAGGYVLSDGGYGQAALLQSDEMLLHVADAEVGEVAATLNHVVPELAQDALIGNHRAAGQATLDEQVVKEAFDRRGRHAGAPQRRCGDTDGITESRAGHVLVSLDSLSCA